MVIRPNVLPTPSQFEMMRQLAERLAFAEGFLPKHFFQGDSRTRPHRILAAIEYGRAVGIEPMIALQNIAIIDGKAGASALLIGALVRKAGYEIQSKVTDDSAQVTISKAGKETGSGAFSITDAKRAGLMRDGSGWVKYPRDMLYARALTQAARQGAQDAVLGMAYTGEELGVETDEDGQPNGEIEPAKISPESRKAMIEALTDKLSGEHAVEYKAWAKRHDASQEALKEVMLSDAPDDNRSGLSVTAGAPQSASPAIAPKRRGRPPGTKNKAPKPQGTQSERSEAGISSSQRGGQTASAMTSAPPLGSTEDGKAEYLESLRQQARQAAAQLARLRVKLTNDRNRERIALGTATTLELPALTPSVNTDAALERFIGARWEGQTLGGLSDSQMETDLLPALQEMIDEIHASGVSESD